ncbi:MAG: hypothetical protein ACI965_000607 [Paraglaciecola sp.]|jgi:hypothetical protein
MPIGLRCTLYCLLIISTQLHALSDLDYLPKNITYNQEIPTPAQVLGTPVGEWHVRHDQLVEYMRLIADKSPRVSLIETGRTHENRPLLLLAFSAPANQEKLDEIQTTHLNTLSAKTKPGDPLVIWMGYGVHGDESSGSNAALLIAYYLAAGEGEQIEGLLADNVILLDPSLNPDGLSRFAQWANMHKGKNLVSDPSHREHQQAWPSARTNHYWFDLNRDWLLLTHPESKARVAQFHRWRPHVLTDFHEMGTNKTYFFQPGISARKNPWTPLKNVALTQALAEFHAAAFDQQKKLYFSQEGYDDFYYGKGSTYPDAHGSVGILFEQASSRGHVQDSIHGPLRFSDTIQNQVTTSLSTFAGAMANKQVLLDYQGEFAQQTKMLIKEDALAGYILTESEDKTRFNDMLSILAAHKIQVWSLKKEVKLGDARFDPLHSVFVPLGQPQYRLIKSLFSERKSFDDNTFYDVSNWNLALAFNVQYKAVEKNLWRKIPTEKNPPIAPVFRPVKVDSRAYAYAFSWQDYRAPQLLQGLLSRNVKVKIAGEAFSAQTLNGSVSFSAGSVLIPRALKQPDELDSILEEQANKLKIRLWSVTSGLTLQGIDFGSQRMLNVEQPKVLLVGGKGTSQYEVGEVWHYLDQRVDLPSTIVDRDKLQGVDLSDYSHIIWVSGNYKNVGQTLLKRVDNWIKQGGVLIGQKSAARWFSEQKWLKTTFVSDDEIALAFEINDLKYADKEAFAAKQRIAGAVFNTQLDLSHPLAFGYTRSTLPVFRNSQVIMRRPESPFLTVARYSESPLLAGYAADELQDLIANSAAVIAHNYGKGKVIAFSDNVNFRGYWRGTSRLLSNALFMSGFINAPG